MTHLAVRPSDIDTVEVLVGEIVEQSFDCAACGSVHHVMGGLFACCCGDEHFVDNGQAICCRCGHSHDIASDCLPSGPCGNYTCCIN